MATLLSQLGVGGNPFTTAVGQRIEQATDGSLASENWALNMEICDVINETDEGPKDALRAIRKRLLQNAGKNYTVVMFTLTVLETCVKNCGKRFQLLVTQKDFVQDLVKLIGPKNDPPTAVQEKVLSLIQSWAETFRSNPEMQGVVQVYNDLKQKGIEFPPSDLETMAPIITPSRSVPVQPPTQHQIHEPLLQDPDATTIHPHQIDKLKKELEIVRGNMRVFGEMLTELVPGKEHQSDLELLQDLCKTCQHMQTRIVELIDRVGNEKITEDLLQVNDELNNLFLRYERFEKKRATMANAPVPEPVFESKPLIDLDESTPISQQLQGLDLNKTDGASAVEESSTISAVDEFDMLAQSRTLEKNVHMGTASNTSGPLAAEAIPIPEPEDAQAEPFPEEFDRFLASRAAAAERLPTINPAAPPSSNNLEKEREDVKSLSPLKS
ncbi:TOM1-like protein 2 isoform X2 [Argiope bruennichi]|uniref:TOM1-like protein 2 isoform X2 n=1 Tax=Argiope bruennichi TaxID=94029 RepID=UPI002494B2E3|nr:TOM1-like protein 2 isoform X2 [Argiope bruennichi]